MNPDEIALQVGVWILLVGIFRFEILQLFSIFLFKQFAFL